MFSRRGFLVTASAAIGGMTFSSRSAPARAQGTNSASLPPYGNSTIPAGIRSRTVANVNGLTVHMLEAGYETAGRPAILLLHGFPELAYSWRKVMLPAGRGGVSRDRPRHARLRSHDRVGPLLRRRSGSVPYPQHGEGRVRRSCMRSAIGRWRWWPGTTPERPSRHGPRLIRPDVFRSVTILSSPFEGPPSMPFDTANGAAPPRPAPTDDELDAELAKLNPPRKYLPELSTHTRRQRQHAACSAGSPRILPRLLSLQERRLERKQAASAEGAEPQRRWPRSRPITSWSGIKAWLRPWRR